MTKTLVDEQAANVDEFQDLIKNVEHIKEIVNVQQTMAKSSGLVQELTVSTLIEDGMSTLKSLFSQNDIEVVTRLNEALPVFYSDKHRILQILYNLLKNAAESLIENQSTDPRIVVSAHVQNEFMEFRVSDNGKGISKSQLKSIFQHGYTTKENGHGFGLHSCANAATEFGGSLNVTSEGVGKGATFILQVPLRPAEQEAQLITSN